VKRIQLEHVLRVAAEITGERDILVIGSQAIHGTYGDDRLPVEATTSIEADLAFFDDPDDEKADLIDGAIGELSRFHETFGYYAQGVSVRTAFLPDGWQERLVTLETAATAPARGLCLEAHDCVVSKLIAGRPKDRDFAAALVRDRLVEPDALRRLVGSVPGLDEGILRRVLVYQTGEEEESLVALVNPRVVESADETETGTPAMASPVTRMPARTLTWPSSRFPLWGGTLRA